METSNQYSELSVHCGSNTDSMEKLVDICKEEADHGNIKPILRTICSLR
nr:MAG TPA: hypothetical protein [Caudoviricetes sp.]